MIDVRTQKIGGITALACDKFTWLLEKYSIKSLKGLNNFSLFISSLIDYSNIFQYIISIDY